MLTLLPFLYSRNEYANADALRRHCWKKEEREVYCLQW